MTITTAVFDSIDQLSADVLDADLIAAAFAMACGL